MILIKNGLVLDPKSGTEQIADLLINQGIIIQIGKNLLPPDNIQTEVIDATDCVVSPGFVDVHVHFRDPGFTYKEDIESGAKAAAKGGFTTVVLMANTKPVVDNTETLSYVLDKGRQTGIHVETCGTITLGLKGEILSPMEELAKAGAVGFTDDGIPILDETILRNAMEMAKKLGLPLSFHEENPKLITNNGINSGRVAFFYGITGSPREAETTLVERDLKIALEIGADINIQHISAKEAVNMVRLAKKQGTNIHAEATPHHFSLTEQAVVEKGTLAKMNPPLRQEADRLAIIAGLKDNTIDIIATDHAPHSSEEKARPITEAPSGILGLETAFSLGITKLVNPGYLTLMELIQKMTYNPAKLYHLPCGYIEEGAAADLVIFDTKNTWTVDTFLSKSQNSPFVGETLEGVIHYTICDGKIVYTNTENKRNIL